MVFQSSVKQSCGQAKLWEQERDGESGQCLKGLDDGRLAVWLPHPVLLRGLEGALWKLLRGKQSAPWTHEALQPQPWRRLGHGGRRLG